MATSKELYFQNSVLTLQKNYFIKRRLAVPKTDGTELLVNGNFNSTNGWGLAAGISIIPSENKVVWTAGNNNALSQTCGINKSSWYRLQFDIKEYQQGFLELKAGSEGRAVSIDASQERFSVDLYSNGNNVIYLTGKDNFRGSLANISLQNLVFYEDAWLDITKYTSNKSITGINKSLDIKSWEFGEIKQDNASLKLINVHGEMSDEENEASIWHKDYIRHRSKIKIESVFCNGKERSADIIFNGLLDDRSAYTSVDGKYAVIENIPAFSYSKILSDITLSELGSIDGSTVNEIVYNIMNRGFFTDFFSVDFSNIKAGYNSVIALSEYEQGDKVIDILKDLAKGHSIFYVDKNDSFHFKPVEPTENVVMVLGLSPERKLKVYDYRSGSERVIENFYWENGAEKYEKPVPVYKSSRNISVKGIKDGGYRQGLLNYLGEKFGTKNFSFKVDIPFCPFIDILDKIQLQQVGVVNENAFILDVSELDAARLELPAGAIKVSLEDNFIVYEIRNTDDTTTLTLLKLTAGDYKSLRLGMVSCWEFINNANDRLKINNGAGINIIYNALPEGLELDGRAATFNGINSYIRVAHAANLSPAGKELSLEVWFESDGAVAGFQCLASKHNFGGYGISVSQENISSQVFTNGAYAYAHTPRPEGWVQAIMVYNGVGLLNYVNGVLAGHTAKGGNIQYTGAGDFTIGAYPDGINHLFKGKIAAVRFWNRELSPREIRQLYNGGKGLSYEKIFNG